MGHVLVTEFVSRESSENVQAVLSNALLGKNTAPFEFPLCTKDGRPVAVLFNATPRIDSSGQLVGVVGVSQGITEKKQAKVGLTHMAVDLQ
mmetsp:Transcript_1438/g.2915  ORF Transcript_1438/g.2915 Transcript_1438/m.2915 type:complete len:91 (+) Transcript_1438:552-824(+)